MKDAILVEKALIGDHQAFHILITRYYTAIHNIILSWVRNPEDAKDLTQDVFISAYQNLPSLKRPDSFYAWLKQIARRRCQNWQRDKQGNLITLQDNLISNEPPVDEVLILRETLAKVMSAIDKLPELEKSLLKEHYLDDASYDELSARHEISTQTLAVRLFRTRRKIKEYLGKTLSAFVAFFHRHSESILTGGVEAVKIGAKIKIMAIGVAGVLVLGGAGVIVWHNQATQEDLATNINQTDQQINKAPSTKDVSGKEDTSDEHSKLKDNQNEKAQISKTFEFLDSLSKDSQDKADEGDSNLKGSKETNEAISIEQEKKSEEIPPKTPEQTMNDFLNVAISGDLELFMSYFRGEAKDFMEKSLENMRSLGGLSEQQRKEKMKDQYSKFMIVGSELLDSEHAKVYIKAGLEGDPVIGHITFNLDKFDDGWFVTFFSVENEKRQQ